MPEMNKEHVLENEHLRFSLDTFGHTWHLDAGAAFAAIRIFRVGLEGSAQDGCEALIPARMGLLVPADGRQPFEQSFGTYEYEGAHMAMAGICKSGAALLATAPQRRRFYSPAA